MGIDGEMDGFAVEGPVARPLIEVDQDTRARLMRVVAAVSIGWTPEEITALMNGDADDPNEVDRVLALPLVGEEMSAHVDVLLAVMQTPVPQAA